MNRLRVGIGIRDGGGVSRVEAVRSCRSPFIIALIFLAYHAGGGSILMHDVAHAPFSGSLARQRVDCASRVAVLPLASFSALRRVKAG